jgi:predicted NBD/HSP70 family sugar kinase
VRLGLDVGGTKTEAVAVDGDGRILASVRMPTERGQDGVIGTVERAATALLAHPSVGEAAAIGIGIPGAIEDGRVRHAVNLGLTELDLGGIVSAHFGVPVGVENDVKAAALGTHRLRGGTEPVLAYLNLGTGVAAGIVIDGRIWRGSGGVAGEVGHMPIDPAGPPCPCGQRGCIETFVGGAAITAGWGRGERSVSDLFDEADAGDAAALAARETFAGGVAAAIRLLVLSFDAGTVVIGGGQAALGGRLREAVARRLRRDAEPSPFLASLGLDARFELLPPASPAPALGASFIDVSVLI